MDDPTLDDKLDAAFHAAKPATVLAFPTAESG